MSRNPSIARHFCTSLLACGMLAPAGILSAADGPLTLAKDIRPVLEEYCFDCHNPDKKKGDVNLEEVAASPKMEQHRAVWDKVAEVLENGDMPPEKKPQPTEGERHLLLSFLDGQLSKLDCTTNRNPGRVTLRRLNRSEYRCTVRDLLHVDYWPEDFPNDEVGYGFDNIADVLSLSPLLMEKFMAAAGEIATKAIVADGKAKLPRFKGSSFGPQLEPAIHALEDDTLAFMREGEASREIDFPKDGDYILKVRAYGDQAGTEPPKLAVRLDGKELKVLSVPVTEEQSATYEVPAHVEHGAHRVAFAYLNNYVDATNSNPKLRGDRNVYLRYLEVAGPPGLDPQLPESHRSLIVKMPKPGEEHAVARELLAPFLKRAYRRPVSNGEVERVAQFVDLAMRQKGSFLEGMQVAVQAVLCSPEFLFRWELDATVPKSGEIRTLNDFQVASRLSYFLWNSMPDEELFGLAERGELLKEGNLEKQTRRMLKDWKAREFVNSFADQWLQLRNIWVVSPDPGTFPKWNEGLKSLMQEEAERFFEAVMKEDRSIYDLVDGKFTFLNEQLAQYYGIDGVKGVDFRKVALSPESPRGGVLTLGGVLLATSTPTRTSPVIRGKWVLEQILGTPPPPPPANVPPLPEQDKVNQSGSLRQRLEAHRAREECAACHKRMDPLGFALENFDATGAWRDKDGKFPIDASGKLPSGKQFSGPSELKQILKSGKNFKVALAEKLMTYALGRGVESYDRCAIDSIVTSLSDKGDKFSALVLGIVSSDPFLKCRAPDGIAQN